MIIRKATSADIPLIMQLVKKVVPLMIATGNYQWSDAYPSTEVFERDVRLDYLWVAEVDGHIAGVTAITTDQDTGYADCGWDINETAIVTHRLAVDPDYRGQRIAEALLNQAEQEAIRRNIPLLRIDTNTKNQATQKLFPKLGYVFAGEISLEFKPGLRFYCYEKKLALA
jgi:ribosomal protein S18 acetylase RimI-like enzyme